jgi:phosphatidylglycerophosphatase A
VLLAALAFSPLVSGRAASPGRHLGVADHGGMVWDEVAAFCWCSPSVPPELPWQLAAFVAFRFFDIAKPPPIRHFERRYHGGFGVMFDDVLAAGYSLLLLAAVKRTVLLMDALARKLASA